MGRAQLVDCINLDKNTFGDHFAKHRVPDGLVEYEHIYAWVIEDAQRYEKPMPYEHKVGAVKWVKLPYFV